MKSHNYIISLNKNIFIEWRWSYIMQSVIKPNADFFQYEGGLRQPVAPDYGFGAWRQVFVSSGCDRGA